MFTFAFCSPAELVVSLGLTFPSASLGIKCCIIMDMMVRPRVRGVFTS